MRAPASLVLIGFMATGKSTVGRRCARELRIPFWDSDAFVEQRAGKPISRIFSEDGESEFRRLESEAIAGLTNSGTVVLSTGGGAPMAPANVEALKRNGVVILLQASAETILDRASRRNNRPLLADSDDPLERITSLLRVRDPVYRSVCDAIVETDGLEHEQVVAAVLTAYWNALDDRNRE